MTDQIKAIIDRLNGEVFNLRQELQKAQRDKPRLDWLWRNRGNPEIIKRIEARDDDESFREVIDAIMDGG